MALSTISGTTGITDATITSAKLADFSAAVDLNGVELILDANGNTSITADTDDRIDFKLGGVEHISLNNSSGDTVIKPMVDGKDIVFQQYDGNKILEINDGNYVAISGAAAGPGELRFYEDTDLGSHYTGLKAGNATASVSYVLPLADGSDGHALKTDGSGTLSWGAAGAISTYSNATNNRVITSVDSTSVNSEANLTFDGSTLAVTGAATVSTTLGVTGILTGSNTVIGTTFEPTGDTSASDNAAIGYTAGEGLILTGQGSTNDVTINNDADAHVISIPTGATNVTIAGVVTATGFTIGSAAITEAELEILDGANVTTTELNLIDGGTARGTDALASGDGILINDAGTMKMTNVDTVSTYFASHNVGGGNIVTTGALNSGSITSGFGTIDTGSSTITTTGDITGGTFAATTDTAAGDNASIGYTAAEGLILTGQGSTSDITIKNDADADVLTVATGTTTAAFAGTLTAVTGTFSGVLTGTTVEATGDTSASDNAAIGYTAAEGLILTGQGSTNDVTIKNDADADVLTIATGATNVDIVGDVTASTVNADGDTAAGDNAAMGYTAGEGLILTGQGSTSDITIKNDADATVFSVATGTTQGDFAGTVTALRGYGSTETDTSNSGTITLDFSADQNFVLTLTGNITLANPSTEAVGQSGFIAFLQDGTGSRTVTLGTDYETAAGAGLTLTTTASATDLVPYLVVAANRILLGAPQLAFS